MDSVECLRATDASMVPDKNRNLKSLASAHTGNPVDKAVDAFASSVLSVASLLPLCHEQHHTSLSPFTGPLCGSLLSPALRSHLRMYERAMNIANTHCHVMRNERNTHF